MKKLCTLLFISISLFSCHFKRQEADLVVYNAIIYSMDENNTTYQAMAIKDGKIVALGKERDILNNFRYDESIDAGTKVIYPGFIDAHCHFVGYANGLKQVNLFGTKSFAEVIKRVQDFAKANPDVKFIVGRGWDHTDWPGKQFPDRTELDELFPNTPILLHRIDGHAALVNGAALKLASLSESSIIKGGILNKNKDGQLSGLLFENAVDSVSKQVPKVSDEELLAVLKRAQKNCFEVGLTSLDDAGLDNRTLLILKKFYEQNKLDIRLYAMASDSKDNFDYFIKNGAIKSDRFNVHSFKFYADGSLGSRSACMIKPYTDAPGNHGILTITPEELEEKLKIAYELNFQANTHAIGDSANSEVLRLYAKVLKTGTDRRWRIEHAQVVEPSVMHLFKDFAIVPSVQSTHATSDSKWAKDRLGEDRVHHAYAYKELLKENGWLPLGTDFPVEGIDPLLTFYSAVFRKTAAGEPANGFQVENSLSRLEALRGMTIWAALANQEENVKGSLEKGKFADFIIVDRDLLKVAEKDVLKTKVERTVVGGKTVYQR